MWLDDYEMSLWEKQGEKDYQEQQELKEKNQPKEALPGTVMPFSIWKVRQFQQDFCSLGDLFVTNTVYKGEPSFKHAVFKAVKPGALIQPVKFHEEFRSTSIPGDSDSG